MKNTSKVPKVKPAKPAPTPTPESTPQRPLRPSLEALSERAALLLAPQRREMVEELQRAYGRRKVAEVKRLAYEAGYTGMIVVDITAKEERVFSVADP